MRELLRRSARVFLWATLAALGLRLFFVFRFPAVVDDSRLYANIAKNWLHYGIYGVTDSSQVVPTLSRLPGYPAFLAAVFAIFGVDNFRAVHARCEYNALGAISPLRNCILRLRAATSALPRPELTA